MLTIQNTNKILHKTLGKKNFYVARVEQKFDMDGAMFTTKNHKYKFELSNRKYAITVTLDRDEWNTDTYKLMSSTNNVVYITKKDIKNMDIFLDKLRLVGID